MVLHTNYTSRARKKALPATGAAYSRVVLVRWTREVFEDESALAGGAVRRDKFHRECSYRVRFPTLPQYAPRYDTETCKLDSKTERAAA